MYFVAGDVHGTDGAGGRHHGPHDDGRGGHARQQQVIASRPSSYLDPSTYNVS